MDVKLTEIAVKVERLLGDLNQYRLENDSLKTDNDELKVKLSGLEKEYRTLKLSSADQSEVVRTKLGRILNHLSELEDLRS
jgi:hypothetical protein